MEQREGILRTILLFFALAQRLALPLVLVSGGQFTKPSETIAFPN
jgi:hypothetical protein